MSFLGLQEDLEFLKRIALPFGMVFYLFRKVNLFTANVNEEHDHDDHDDHDPKEVRREKKKLTPFQ